MATPVTWSATPVTWDAGAVEWWEQSSGEDDTTAPLTPEQIRALIVADAVEIEFGAELLDENDVVIGDLSGDLAGGEIEHHSYADVHGTCRLRLTRELDWVNTRVRPYMRITGKFRD
jgi:hypothetical protein